MDRDRVINLRKVSIVLTLLALESEGLILPYIYRVA